MLSASYQRTACRLCGSLALQKIFSLTPTPPANAFVSQESLNEEQQCFPLDVFRCNDCGHLQLTEIVSPEILFRHYVYVSGTSSVMVEHLRNTAEAVADRGRLSAGDFVLEFGSNDGTLLRMFKEKGMKVLGVDPAANIAEMASRSGIETLADFFSPQSASRIASEFGKPKAICANNVCAHIDDLAGVFDAVSLLLADDGLFVFEVGYLLDIVTHDYFDTIYHEHVDFHHVEPLVQFCARHGLELIHVERITVQGGSIRCYAQLWGGPHAVSASVSKAIAEEREQGLHKPETFIAFGKRIEQRRTELVSLLEGLKARGKTIAAFGAPAKSTTLMYHFGLSREVIEFIVDENPLKQGLFTPGLHIPVVHQAALNEKQPDYLILLAWNFASNIMRRYQKYPQSGGRFILPLPNLALYGVE